MMRQQNSKLVLNVFVQSTKDINNLCTSEFGISKIKA